MQQLTIPVANVATMVANGFTTIEIWEASDYGEPYYEVTSTTALPATLASATALNTFEMGGWTLKLAVDGGTTQVITFDPLLKNWTPAQVAARINLVVPLLATVVAKQVILTSPTSGRASRVYIEYSDSPNLGFVAGTVVRGTAQRIALVDGTVLYYFSDVAADSKTRFKWRFSVDGADPFTDYSEPIYGLGVPVPGLALSIAYAQFSDASGRPLKRSVIIASDAVPSVTAGVVVGSYDTITTMSDDLGFFQFPLVQGARVRVAIEGTALVRQITVPATDTFELMSALAAAPDPFSPQSVPPLLIRQNI